MCECACTDYDVIKQKRLFVIRRLLTSRPFARSVFRTTILTLPYGDDLWIVRLYSMKNVCGFVSKRIFGVDFNALKTARFVTISKGPLPPDRVFRSCRFFFFSV